MTKSNSNWEPGLIVLAVLLPMAYAAAVCFVTIDGYGQHTAGRLAVSVAMPLVVSGLVKWWDVWVNPGPKMGQNWKPYSPQEYIGVVAKVHGLVICIGLALFFLISIWTDNAGTESDSDFVRRWPSNVAGGFLVIAAVATVFGAPKRLGWHSGQPITD